MRFCSVFVLLYIARKLENRKEGRELKDQMRLEGSSVHLSRPDIPRALRRREMCRHLLKILPK